MSQQLIGNNNHNNHSTVIFNTSFRILKCRFSSLVDDERLTTIAMERHECYPRSQERDTNVGRQPGNLEGCSRARQDNVRLKSRKFICSLFSVARSDQI